MAFKPELMIKQTSINSELNELIGIVSTFKSRTQVVAEFGNGTKNKKLDIVTNGSSVFYEVTKDKKPYCKFESLYSACKAYINI